MSDKLIELFVQESQELLADLEKAMLTLEQDLHNEESISIVFRALHTLKGAAGMFGYDAVGRITHQLENIFQDIRDDHRSMDATILDITLKSVDHLRDLMTDPLLANDLFRVNHERLLDQIQDLVVTETVDGEQTVKRPEPILATFYVHVVPHAELLRHGNNTLYLIEDLLAIGEGIAIPYFYDLPALNDINPSDSHLGFEVILKTKRTLQDIREVFMFVESECKLIVLKLGDGDWLLNSTDLIQASVVNKPIGVEEVKRILKIDELKPAVISTNGKTNHSSIRVDAGQVDEFMNLVSELVTIQAQLTMVSGAVGTGQLITISENVEKITRRLRDNAFNMSLVPLESLVVRFQRLVRDLSRDLNKEVQFITEGSDTKIDKSMIEKLIDPLLHLLRNSIDHGIESPDIRISQGKPGLGTVRLRSYYSGANVVIEVDDDGGGIDTEKVLAKARNKGLVEEGVMLSEREILELIFVPGFSTANQITGVSGRGVGMDVVKRNIEDVRGDVEVTTQIGKGTMFTIRLPLTLSIVDGLLVWIGSTPFVLPLNVVAKCFEVATETFETAFNHWVTLDGVRTPFVYLRDVFDIQMNKPYYSQMINIPFNQRFVGLVVDRIEGEIQAVLKPLGPMYEGLDEYSGATILGDGTVALVLDPVKLIRKVAYIDKNELN